MVDRENADAVNFRPIVRRNKNARPLASDSMDAADWIVTVGLLCCILWLATAPDAHLDWVSNYWSRVGNYWSIDMSAYAIIRAVRSDGDIWGPLRAACTAITQVVRRDRAPIGTACIIFIICQLRRAFVPQVLGRYREEVRELVIASPHQAISRYGDHSCTLEESLVAGWRDTRSCV